MIRRVRYFTQQDSDKQLQAVVQTPFTALQQALLSGQQPGIAQQTSLVQQAPPLQQLAVGVAAALREAVFAAWNGWVAAAWADDAPPNASAATKAAKVRNCFMDFPNLKKCGNDARGLGKYWGSARAMRSARRRAWNGDGFGKNRQCCGA